MTKEEIHENWWNGDRNNPSCCEGVGTGYEYQKRITELEKENAELKKQLEMSNKVYNDNLDYSHHIEEQLTNAKEIISELLCHYNAKTIYIANMQPTLDKAEQFLSEVEK